MKDTLQIAIIKIDQLQAQIDSLKQSAQIDKMQFRVDRELEIVQQVNEYYISSFQILALAFTIVGVLIPIGIQWYQQSRIKALNTKTVQDISKTFNEKIAALNLQFEAKSGELKNMDTIMKLRQGATIYFAQGHTYYNEKDCEYALYNLIRAANNWFQTKDEEEFEFIIMLIKTLVNDIIKDDIDKVNLKLNAVGIQQNVIEMIDKFYENKSDASIKNLLREISDKLKSIVDDKKEQH